MLSAGPKKSAFCRRTDRSCIYSTQDWLFLSPCYYTTLVIVDTKPSATHIDVRSAIICRICVQGRITPNWRDRFEDLAIATAVAPDGVAITILQGVLPDQAALVGVINGLHDLRLAVLSVECLANAP